ncbi:MAG: hypothetical protein JWQ38_2524 [Flavipsychrobacter sp.]|nr:hypothetical protein [Flavipsychrobacter sp.]
MSWEIYTIPELGPHLQNFMQIYEIHKIVECPDKKPKLKSKHDRICRFCKKQYPKVRFRKDAHVIPRLLGNRFLVSDFECDSCNEKFGRFENDLSDFIGITKTIFQTKGQNNKVPSFRAPNDVLTATRINAFNIQNSIEIRKKNVDDENLIINDSSGEITIKYPKRPYRPFNVYKAFLKIALSCIDDEDVINYCGAFNILTNGYMSESVKGLARIYKYSITVGGGKDKPLLFIYKKRNAWLNFPTYFFALHFQNSCYQFFPPFYRADKFVYDQDGAPYPICPPISTEPFPQDVKYNIECVDLSSGDLEKEDEETVVLKSGLNDVESIIGIDPVTRRQSTSKYSSDKIVGVILVPAKTVITFEE